MAASTDCGSARNWLRVATASSRVGTVTPSIRTLTLVIGSSARPAGRDQPLEPQQVADRLRYDRSPGCPAGSAASLRCRRRWRR